jgi:hypothetical protein
MRILAASVFIASLTVGIGWNGHGTMTIGMWLLAIVGAWCLLNFAFLGGWSLLVDHWRRRAEKTTRRGSSDRGQGRKPRLVAHPPSPAGTDTTPVGLPDASGLGAEPRVGGGTSEAQSHAAHGHDRGVRRGDPSRTVAHLAPPVHDPLHKRMAQTGIRFP